MIQAAPIEMRFWNILRAVRAVLFVIYFDLLSYLFNLLQSCCEKPH